jgi:hypothetical protein
MDLTKRLRSSYVVSLIPAFSNECWAALPLIASMMTMTMTMTMIEENDDKLIIDDDQ